MRAARKRAVARLGDLVRLEPLARPPARGGDGPGGVLELETPQAAQAETFVRGLPLVPAGLVRCTTHALSPPGLPAWRFAQQEPPIDVL